MDVIVSHGVCLLDMVNSQTFYSYRLIKLMNIYEFERFVNDVQVVYVEKRT